MFIEQGNSTVEGVGNVVRTWNKHLSARVKTFTATHKGVQTTVVSTYNVFNRVMDKNPTAAACFHDDGVTCLWWNNYHPATALHDAVAKKVVQQTKSFF